MRGDANREVPSKPVRPWELEVGEVENEDFDEIACEEQEEEESRKPEVLRDPGADPEGDRGA